MRRDTILRTIFWVALAVALAAALNPQPPRIPGQPSDKIQHILAFLALTAMALAAHPRAKRWAQALALSGFGALIEFLQMIPALHRSAELMDWVADTGAVLVVILLAAILRLPRPG